MASPAIKQHPGIWWIAGILSLFAHGMILWAMSSLQINDILQKPEDPLSIDLQAWEPPPEIIEEPPPTAETPDSFEEPDVVEKPETQEPSDDILLNDLIQETPAEELSIRPLRQAQTQLPQQTPSQEETPSSQEIKAEDSDDETSQQSEEVSEAETIAALPENYFLQPPETTFAPDAPTVTSQESEASALPQRPAPPRVTPQQKREGGLFYELSDYNWPYESYMGRWAKGLLYQWYNNPPLDYYHGHVPEGGAVFVLVVLNGQGQVTSYDVTHVDGASEQMVSSVINAILGGSNLPALPRDVSGKQLVVHFRFGFAPIQ